MERLLSAGEKMGIYCFNAIKLTEDFLIGGKAKSFSGAQLPRF